MTMNDYWAMIANLAKTAGSPKMRETYAMMIRHHEELKRGIGITPERIREMAYEVIPDGYDGSN